MNHWWTKGVSLRGTSHIKKNKPCQDFHCVAQQDGATALVVCDGAGSADLSQHGSELVARKVSHFLVQNAEEVMDRTLGGEVVMDVVLSVLKKAAILWDAPLEELSTTLVALLVHDSRLMTCHIGDGAIYGLFSDVPVCISPPEGDGESRTVFVTTKGVKPRMWSMAAPKNLTGLLLTSDGADRLMNPATGHVSRVVTELTTELDRMYGTDLETVTELNLRPTSADDITVLAARVPYVAGEFGCHKCSALAVKQKVSASGDAILGKCQACGELVFQYPDRGAAYLGQKNARARLRGEATAAGRTARLMRRKR